MTGEIFSKLQDLADEAGLSLSYESQHNGDAQIFLLRNKFQGAHIVFSGIELAEVDDIPALVKRRFAAAKAALAAGIG